MNVTNSIVDFFQGNPFNNPVGSYIEKATDSKNEVENWTLFMEICDTINAMEDGPKLAIRAIKRILNSEIGNNTTSILYTLILLETCVKNCGYRFHLVVCTRDFLQDLEKLVISNLSSKQGKYEVPIVVRDRILVLIQTWYNSFKRQPDLKEIESTYMYLLECGVQFPPIDVSTMSPINTPKKVQKISPNKSTSEELTTTVTPVPTTVVTESHSSSIPDNVIDKLSKNLLVVQANIDVLSELMNDYPPSDSVPDDVICLMKNLESICQQMQLRLVELVNTWDETDQTSASVLFDLLRVNDEMNTVLIQYERYERARTSQKNPTGEQMSTRLAYTSLSGEHISEQTMAGASDSSDVMRSSKSKDGNVVAGLAQGTDEVEPLLSRDSNNGKITSSATALSSQEFDQFLHDRAQNSFSINGDCSVEVSSTGRVKPFGDGHKTRESGKESFDL